MAQQSILPVPVVRDAQGAWTHPGLCGPGSSWPASFSAWLGQHRLRCDISVMMHDDPAAWLAWDDNGRRDMRHWQPLPPDPDAGWFTGSIHDPGDGPVCYWLCAEEEQ